ncbi:hypothetical protein WK03_06685 [Burkholderia cepacia]|nr:hypothetical protein WK03_06685 [Burkholderia cepacia]
MREMQNISTVFDGVMRVSVVKFHDSTGRAETVSRVDVWYFPAWWPPRAVTPDHYHMVALARQPLGERGARRTAVWRMDAGTVGPERQPVKRAYQRFSVNFSAVPQMGSQVRAVRLDGMRFATRGSIHHQLMSHERNDTDIASLEFFAEAQGEPAVRIRHRAARLDHRSRKSFVFVSGACNGERIARLHVPYVHDGISSR